jgi:CRP-like cAMP-binding protein
MSCSMTSREQAGGRAVAHRRARSATVVATSDLAVLEIAQTDLRKLLKRAPSVVRKLLEALSLRLRETDALVTSST